MFRTTAATPKLELANVTVRHAGAGDERALARLASLDSAPRLHGPALLAEADARVLAALPLGSGRPIADPFEPTAELVALLRAAPGAAQRARRPEPRADGARPPPVASACPVRTRVALRGAGFPHAPRPGAAIASVVRMSSEFGIEATGLRKSYGSVQALRGVDLRAPTGTVLGLLGPNGAGKTTAVRILTTLLRPDAGSARVAGLDVVGEAAALRSQIGLAGQYAAVDENLTGFENLEMVGRLYHLGAPALARARERASGALRAGRGERAPRAHLLRRHAPPARPGGLAGGPPAGALPRRAHHRPRSPQPRRLCSRRSRDAWRRARPCCSPPRRWTRPTGSPTGSR